MVENIKIMAKELKRQLKISIYLPTNYNTTNQEYPLIYVLDGQLMFHSLDDENKAFDLPSILENSSQECICVGIHSPKNEEWRISELCPFYKKDESNVDPSLANVFADYIVNTLHPLLSQRYRFNTKISILGFKEGAILALYALNQYSLFSSAGVFSPQMHICNVFHEDLTNISNKKIYLYFGGRNEDHTNLFYNLFSYLEKNSIVKLIYEESEENCYISWKEHILDFLNYSLT